MNVEKNICSCIFLYYFCKCFINWKNWLKIYVDLTNKRSEHPLQNAVTNVVTEERRVVPDNCVLLNVIVKFIVGWEMAVLENYFLPRELRTIHWSHQQNGNGSPRWSMQELDLCHDTVQEYSPREYEINATVRKAWP